MGGYNGLGRAGGMSGEETKYEPSMVHEQGRGNKGRLWEGRSMRRDNSTGAWEGPGRVQEPGMGYEPGRGQFDRGLWRA